MATTAQYWRLYFNDVTQGSTVVSIAEWNFYDASGTVISRSGGTSSSSSHFNSSFVDSNAFDGNAATAWAGLTAPSSGSPQWLQYQFSSAVAVKSISITLRNDVGEENQGPTAFLVQTSPDGSTWTTQQTYTGVVWTSVGQSQLFFADSTAGNAIVSQIAIEPLSSGPSNTLISQIATETMGGSNPSVLTTQVALEILGGSNPNILLSQIAVEIIYPFVLPTPNVIEMMVLP